MSKITEAHAKAEQEYCSQIVELNKSIDALLDRVQEYELQLQTQARETPELTAKLHQEEQEVQILTRQLMEAHRKIEVSAAHAASRSRLSGHALIHTGGQSCRGCAGYKVSPCKAGDCCYAEEAGRAYEGGNCCK